MPRPAILIEVVDVVAAERRGERGEHIVDRHAELLCFFAIDVDGKLRHRRAPQCLRTAQHRIAVGACEERVLHFVQSLCAAGAAILNIELEAAGGSQAEDRRRIECQHQRFLDAGGLAEQLADQLRRFDLALVPMLLRDKDRRGVVAKAAADEIEAGEGDDVRVCGIGTDRLLDLVDDLERALERRAVGQDHRADVVALILVGHEASGRRAPQVDRDGDHAEKKQRADQATAQHPCHAAGVAAAHVLEERVEAPEETSRLMMLALQDQHAQRWCQRQCDQSGDHNGNRDRYRELAIELAGEPAQECDRDEHRRQDEHDRDDRPRDLAHRPDGGAPRIEMLFTHVPLDVLQHDDRVVDDDPDRQHYAE